MMTLFLQTVLIISLASLGFRAITGKGMIFYFLRKPFDKLSSRKNRLEEDILVMNSVLTDLNKDQINAVLGTEDFAERQKNIDTILQKMCEKTPNKYDWLLYIMKPFILCSTCMASVHTLIWYPVLIKNVQIEMIILCMLCVALLNTLLWSLIEKIQK